MIKQLKPYLLPCPLHQGKYARDCCKETTDDSIPPIPQQYIVDFFSCRDCPNTFFVLKNFLIGKDDITITRCQYCEKIKPCLKYCDGKIFWLCDDCYDDWVDGYQIGQKMIFQEKDDE